MRLHWDYTNLAATYDARADYDSKLIKNIVKLHRVNSEDEILDLGAGTGKLTKELIACGLKVIASEPNEAMRSKGKENVTSTRCRWISSAAESVDVPKNSIASAWFGSSFNVVDHNVTLNEFRRYSRLDGWLTCLWNHRDLEDPVQKSVESIFMEEIPSYSYGSRRQDPTELLMQSRLFRNVEKYSSNFQVTMDRNSYIDAWKSHGTLLRQSRDGAHFDYIIQKIEKLLSEYEKLTIPYTTRLWTAQRVES